MMTIMKHIEINPKVCNGKPVIKGTRIPISVILEQIAQGESWDHLLKGYPSQKYNKPVSVALSAGITEPHS